jgi:hypothetical protein
VAVDGENSRGKVQNVRADSSEACPRALCRFKDDGDSAEFPKAHAFSGCVDLPVIG